MPEKIKSPDLISKIKSLISKLTERYFPKVEEEKIKRELARILEEAESDSSLTSTSERGDVFEIGAELRFIEEQVQEVVRETLTKIGRQMGSNEGGLYEDPETGERFYLKFYRNPDQARVECIANAIYRELGIKTAESEVVEVGGRIAFKSKEIKGKKTLYRDELRGHRDVISGFIADAFLGNWDVMGACFDNVVQGEDGGIYRIDNGGSLTFRARGDEKDFPPHEIIELKTMLDPRFTSGQVFQGITYETMREQARHLVDTLTDEVIIKILREYDLKGDQLRRVAEGLIGRREFLRKHFDLDKKEEKITREERPTFNRALKELLNSPIEREKGFLRKFSFRCDGDKIEDQEIGMVDRRRDGQIMLSFKLLEAQKVIADTQRLPEFLLNKGYKLETKNIQFSRGLFSKEKTYYEDMIYENWLEIEYEGIIVKISLNKPNSLSKRVSIGSVSIILPAPFNSKINPEEIQKNLNQIFQDIFKIDEGISLPKENEVEEYKRNRYKWFKKLPSDRELTLTEEGEFSSMVEQEIVPGYSTYVIPDRHKNVEESHGEVAIYHQVADYYYIPHILMNGLLSSTERYKRGLAVNGISTISDLDSGGGDFVFTRLVSQRENTRILIANKSNIVILDPRLLNRTDSFSYVSDKYGDTAPDTFSKRSTVEELLSVGKLQPGNETMFKCGISPEDIRGIGCEPDLLFENYLIRLFPKESISEIRRISRYGKPSEMVELLVRNGYNKDRVNEFILENSRFRTIMNLLDFGITTIQGMPIEEFVTTINSNEDVLNIAHRRKANREIE